MLRCQTGAATKKKTLRKWFGDQAAVEFDHLPTSSSRPPGRGRVSLSPSESAAV